MGASDAHGLRRDGNALRELVLALSLSTRTAQAVNPRALSACLARDIGRSAFDENPSN